MKQLLLLILISTVGFSFAGFNAEAKKIDSYEKSNLFYFDGVYVLDLHGTREEMMFAHGYFASKNVKAQSPIDYFSTVMDKALTGKFGTVGNQIVNSSVRALLKLRMSKDDEKAFKAFAKGYGQPADKVLKAVMYPDFGEILLAFNYSKNKSLVEIPNLGCSSFVVPKSEDNTGMLFGRNLEFGGVGAFDRYPAIVYLNSTDAKDQPYIQMTSLGLPGTHTAYNKSGLMISLHQLSVNQYAPVGDLILNVVDEVARRATTIEEAKAIVESKKFTTTWKIIVASESQNVGFVAETSPEGAYFTNIDGLGRGESNHATEAKLQVDEYFPTHNFIQSTMLRKAVMSEALKSKSIVNASDAVELLSHRKDLNGENSFLSLSKFSNIMSVVMAAGEHELYFAVANRVNTKPSAGVYMKFPLSFGADFENFVPKIHRPNPAADDVLAVDYHIRAATSERSQAGNMTVVLENIKRAATYYPASTDLNHAYVATLLKMYGLSNGKTESYLIDAANALEQTKSLFRTANQNAVHGLLAARIAALKDDKADIKAMYQSISPTTTRMKAAIDQDLKDLRSNKVRSNIIESSKKLGVSLDDLDIADY